MASPPPIQTLDAILADHLSWWGLRQFSTESHYFQWQRTLLSTEDVTQHARLLEAKRASGHDRDEVAFYDFSSRPDILSALHSERYDYYLTVGLAVTKRVAPAGRVIDFGCGPGILTTFYARRFPNCTFLGIDRSQTCIGVARDKAAALQLTNVHFECTDLVSAPLPPDYDLVIATHALLQAERDPGIPSASWKTFERAKDPRLQTAFEQRTGLMSRLQHLCTALVPHGRLILFEKTRHLARRVPFQRTLSALHLRLLESPLPLRYRLVEEVVEDGPLYVLSQSPGPEVSGTAPEWDESPEASPEQEIYRCSGTAAQTVWERLPDRACMDRAERQDQRLGHIRIERGTAGKILPYLHISAETRFVGILVGGPRAAPLVESCFEAMRKPKEDEPGQLDVFLQTMWAELSPPEHPLETPLYENHTCAAEAVWTSLPNRRILREWTNRAPGGRELHIELGVTGGFTYLYCANTFDQRQLVLVDHARQSLLEDYYRELRTSQ